MQVKIPKIVAPLDLGEYAPQLRGQVIQVWVNPPPVVRKRYWSVSDLITTLAGEQEKQKKIQPGSRRKKPAKPEANGQGKPAEELNRQVNALIGELDACIAEIWSQGPEGTHFTAEEVGQFRAESYETDPLLLPWMVSASLRMMLEHQGALKKNSSRSAAT